MAKNVLVLKHFEQPQDEGVWWRLMCLTGQSKGEAYVLTGNRVVLGRGDKVDVKVMDTKSSREHAEIVRHKDGWILSDLNSQNGVLVNDKPVTQTRLSEGDKIVIGQTVYKFGKVEVKPGARTPEKFEASATEKTGSKKTSSILVLVIIAALAIIFLDSSPETSPETSSKKRIQSTKVKDVSDEFMDMVRKKQLNDDKAQKQKMSTIFQRGLREYREKNYFRAINEFNLALILNPNDPLADFYLRKTKEDLDKSISDHFIKAKRDEEALRYQSAMVSYCAIIRLLDDYKTDERYISAEEGIKFVEGKMGLDPGESYCLKKQSIDQ